MSAVERLSLSGLCPAQSCQRTMSPFFFFSRVNRQLLAERWVRGPARGQRIKGPGFSGPAGTLRLASMGSTRQGASSMEPSQSDVTLLLKRLREGDKGVLHQLVPVVHGELHRLASGYMRYERPNHTLQTT